MDVLYASPELSAAHDTGAGHPESPARLEAVRAGIAAAGVAETLVEFAPRPASDEELTAVHDASYVRGLEAFCRAGGGALDADTAVSVASYEAARRAAGAGPEAIDRLRAGEASAAFLALRPPGHHALHGRAMGFCLFNNVAVSAAALRRRGERVVVFDFDAHHGNGTQASFYDDPDVLYISLHQWPWYPFTGAVDEIGAGEGLGATINVPLPAGTAGDGYRLAFDELVAPAVARFSPTWLLVSAGFDAHRADPLAELGLSAADFADLTARAAELVAPGRRIFFLEGGYDLAALAASAGACVAALAGASYRPEAATSGETEPARDAVRRAGELQCQLGRLSQ